MKIRVIFSDIGGVLLSNGWEYQSRQKFANQYQIDFEEMEIAHRSMFSVYEMGKYSLEEYLAATVFQKSHDFSMEEVKQFMFHESHQLPDMLPWMIDFKKNHPAIKFISINNEAKELNTYRINHFKLHELFDAFVSSGEVGMRKPDPDIFRLALGIAQVQPKECVFIDDRKTLTDAASKLGMNTVHHTNFSETVQRVNALFKDQ